ncbi:MAG: hypothetical protein RML46_09420 [Anaerolineae bacterium]|nr:hypothetical protein [Anaerolineae bacterium]
MSRETHRTVHFSPLLGLIAAVDVYRATLQMLGEEAREPERRRELLVLWRPCQEYLDHLLDILPAGWTGPLRLLRQEIEDGLLDDPLIPSALTDALDALSHACETLLHRLPEDLHGGNHAPGF